MKFSYFQVSPTELENLISQLKGVADVAVVGIPDVLSGEIPRAFVVKSPGSDISEKAILNHVEKNVVAYKKLAGGVRFLDLIPRNPSGKVLRNELKVFGNNPSEQPQNWFKLVKRKRIKFRHMCTYIYNTYLIIFGVGVCINYMYAGTDISSMAYKLPIS